MENRSERDKEIPSKSMPNTFMQADSEGESSLNPYALEFIPSHMMRDQSDKRNHRNTQKMKTEATSTTTLVQREIVGDASFLHAQRQLFELLHQMGENIMPLKAIKLSLAPDGQGINVQFKAEQGTVSKQMLDENLCQDAALHMEMSDRSFMTRKLPNVLAANFMARMGDVLNHKIERNDPPNDTNCLEPHQKTDKPIIEPKFSSVSFGSEKQKTQQKGGSIPGKELGIKKRQQPLNGIRTNHHRITFPRPSLASKVPAQLGSWSGVSISNGRIDTRQKIVNPNQESQHDKKSNKGTATPRQCIGRVIKKGLTDTQKFTPRSTYTSLIRQSEVQKRLNRFKDDNN